MDWLAAHSLLDLSGIGLLPGILVGHLLLTLAMYCWHRATHTFDILWRGFHQIHHSPRHLNVYVAGANHPLDISIYIVLPFVVGILVLGLSPFQATMLSNIAGFNAFPFTGWGDLPLCSVRSRAYELGEAGAASLLERLEQGSFTRREQVLPLELVPGSSA